MIQKNPHPKIRGEGLNSAVPPLFILQKKTGRIFIARYAGLRLRLLFIHRSSSEASSSALLPVCTNHRLSQKRVETTTPHHSLCNFFDDREVAQKMSRFFYRDLCLIVFSCRIRVCFMPFVQSLFQPPPPRPAQYETDRP